MDVEVKQAVSFGPFHLDPEARQLLREGQPVSLTPKAFDALLFLAQNGGRLISKEELMKALWPDAYVCDSNLTQTVFMLRKALGKAESGQSYIVTVPGRGYRFVADVAPPEPVPFPSKSETVPLEKTSGSRRRWSLVVLVVLMGLGAIAGVRWWRARRAVRSDRVLLAVLPFENFTGDPSQEYFSDGLTEDMIAKLGHLNSQKLGVIGRTSVMHYKKSGVAIDQIARDLGVQYVLEGSVQRGTDKIRITAQLIQTKDQSHIWARQYDRQLGEVLTTEDEIAQEIADEIRLTLGDNKKPTPNRQSLTASEYKAYDLYLRGRYFWNKRTAESLRLAIENFQQAIAIAPNYAPAYAGLADSYAMMSGYTFVAPNEAMPKARAAALKALQLDDSLAEAHTSLAEVAENYDWDWETAEKEFRRAIQLNPNYPTAHQWYAEFLAFQGRFDEALAESERAQQLDPLSLIIASDNAAIYYFAGRDDEAIQRFRRVLAMEPTFPRAQLIIAAYAQKGQYDEAFNHLQEWHRKADGPWPWAWEAYLYARIGEKKKVLHAFQEMKRMARREPVESPAMFVVANLGMNNKDETFAWLEKGFRERSNLLTALKVDPLFEPLRGDPRFQEMLRRLKMP